MLRATLKDLWARKIRLVTTGIAVLLGVAFMSGTLVLTDTIGRTFTDLFAGAFEGTDAIVRAESNLDGGFGPGGDEQRPRVDDALVATVAAVDGVALARGDIFRNNVLIVGADGKAIGGGQGPPTFGGQWSDDALNPYTLREGRAPAADDEVVIDVGSAEEGDLAIGDRTAILTPERVEVTIVGLAGFGTVDSIGGSTFVGMTVAAAQQHLTEPGKWDSVGVIAAEGVDQRTIADRIAAVLPDGHEVLTGEEATEENQDQVKQALGFFEQILLVFAYVALFVGSFIIYNTFGIIVAQRTRELALFRALGASRRQVLRSVLVEASIVGFIASALGLVLGVLFAMGLKSLLKNAVDLPAGSVVVSVGTIVTSIVTGMVIAVTSAYLPARRASKVPPLAAMREVAVDRSAVSRRRKVAGPIILGLGVALLLAGLFGSGNRLPKVGFGVLGIFVGVAVLGPVLASPVARVLGAPIARLRGMPGVLARENALRNPNRTSSTAAALMIGVALVGFITVFAASATASINKVIGDRFAADLIVDSGSFGAGGGLPPSLTEELRALPELEAVSSVRATLATVDGSSAFIFGIDTTTMPALFDVGVTAGSWEGLDDRSIALQQDWAEDHGFGLGDTVDVQLVEGPVEPLTVNMLYEDNVFATGYFLPRTVFDRGVPDQVEIQIYMTIADGVSPGAARQAVDRVTQPYPTAKVNDVQGFQEQQAAQFNILLGLVYVLLMLAIVIALLGIMNTLALSVFERTHEIGLLRAIGMSRRQTRTAVRWESVIIALLGTVIGLALGLFFGWVMSIALRDQGLEVFSVPIGQLLFISFLAAVAGVIAAIWPAHKAARLNVLAAIAAE